MARRVSERQVHVRLSFVSDPESVRAAQEILQEGFRRAMARSAEANLQQNRAEKM